MIIVIIGVCWRKKYPTVDTGTDESDLEQNQEKNQTVSKVENSVIKRPYEYHQKEDSSISVNI